MRLPRLGDLHARPISGQRMARMASHAVRDHDTARLLVHRLQLLVGGTVVLVLRLGP